MQTEAGKTTAISDDQDSVFLRVYQGDCRHLTSTDQLIAVPRAVLPEGFERCALQKSSYENVFWLLVDRHRFHQKCWCSRCKVIFSGAGQNLYSHLDSHSRRRHYTASDMLNALFLFMLKHGIGLSAARDPLLQIFHPTATYLNILDLLDSTVSLVKSEITRLLGRRDYFLMIDGWSDQSLRRFVGVVAGYFSFEQNRMMFYFLELCSMEGLDHSALSQKRAILQVLRNYGLEKRLCYCLASDSATVNTAIADDMSLDWCPCSVHLRNLIVRHFIANSPASLTNLLERINTLRKKSRWVEYLASRGKCRNIAGYSPTRWCSACQCLESFYDLKDCVFEYQKGDKQTSFTEEDVSLVEEIRLLFRRFVEVNDLLEAADAQEGLATVFQAVNAIGSILSRKTEKESQFHVAYQRAVEEINQRFFNRKSKFSCRIIFAGILDVAHSIPEWLDKIMDDVAPILLSELELFTGSTPPHSPRESQAERYDDHRPIQEILGDSAPPSERSEQIFDELHDFFASRRQLEQLPFTVFWRTCPRFCHIKQMAMKLRAYPTSTVALEQSFSRARRILSWSRLKMSQDTANKQWMLICNETTTRHVMRLEQDHASVTPEIVCHASDFSGLIDQESDGEEVFNDDSEGE